MSDKEAIGRRSFLGLSGALGLGGLGLASGLAGGGTSALATEEALRKAMIFTSSGDLSLIFGELMQQEGFFRQMGIEATTQSVADGGKVIAALIGGDGDMCGGAGFSSLFPAIEKGAKIKILAGAGLSTLISIYSKRPDIKSAKDLIGKTVGTGTPGAQLHQLVVALLLKKGVDYTKVNFVNVGSGPDVFKNVVSGTIDAGPCPGEVEFNDQYGKYGVHALTDGAFWNELPEYTNQAMFASEQTIAEKREILVRIMAAYGKLYRFVSGPTSYEAFSRARAKGLNNDSRHEAEAQWNFYQKPGRLATNLVLSPERIRYAQELNVRLGVQKVVMPFEQVADMSLAEDALKLMG